MTRRKDTELRAAIDEVQNALHENLSLRDIYNSSVLQIMRISRARFGVVYSYNNKSESEPFVPISALESHGLTIGTVQKMQFFNQLVKNGRAKALEFWSKQFACGETVMEEKPFSNNLRSAFPISALINNHIALIPLLNKGICDLVIALGSEEKFTDALLHRLWPLLSVSINIRNAFLANIKTPTLDVSLKPVRKITPIKSDSYKELFHRLQNYCLHAVIVTNNNGNIVSANRVAHSMLELFNGKSMVGCNISAFICESFPNQFKIRLNSLTSLEQIKNRYFPTRMECRSTTGKILQVDMTFFQYTINKQDFNIFLFYDQTQLLEQKQIREEEERRFHAVADLIPIGILQTNERWECVYVNNSWCEMSGLSRDEVSDLGWVNSIHESDSYRVLESLAEHIRRGSRYEETCRFQNPLGRTIWIDLNASPLISESGTIEGFIATANDVTLHRITEDKLRRVAQYDPLTQLANRSLLLERLTHLLTRMPRTSGEIAVLYMDLDGFKYINDSLGHDCGDCILKEVAKRLTGCVRKNDTVARLGGDEFTIILEDIRQTFAASTIADKIIKAIAKPYQIGSQEVFLTASIGIAIANKDDMDASQLLKQADIALYKAKAEGKNNYQFYSSKMSIGTRDRLNVGNLLHRALERNEFYVVFQPQANIATGTIKGFEALLRWAPSGNQEIPTQQFIPLLEETGLIQSVGRWLIDEAIGTFSKWQGKAIFDQSVNLAINLSPRQFWDKQLLNTVLSALEKYSVDPKSIVFEITETLLLGDTDRCRESILKIKETGVGIALDDFGTGFSSLSHLKNFPIDIIKIDQSFIRDLLSDKEDEAIVRAVLAMAASLDKQTVAEGVDDSAKLQLLRDLGCHHYQGFLLSKPARAEEIDLFLAKNDNLYTNYQVSTVKSYVEYSNKFKT